MASPVSIASRAGRESRKALAGERVRIYRGEVVGPEVVVTVGETRVEEYAEDGSVFSIRFRDFLIDRVGKDAYQIDSGPVDPKIGDRILQEVGGQMVMFEVVPATSERGSRRSDRRGRWWRVHTKEVGTAEV